MSPLQGRWGFAPDSGGVRIPEPVKRRTEERLRRYAERHFGGLSTRLDIRFRGQFCYVVAYTESEDRPGWPAADWPESREEYLERLRSAPTHLCRLRFCGDEEGWGFGFFTYSHQRYEVSIFPSGDFLGPPMKRSRSRPTCTSGRDVRPEKRSQEEGPMSEPERGERRRQLRVDLAELVFAMDSGSAELHHYLDLETGEVVVVADETRRELERIYEEEGVYDDEGQEVVPFAEVLARLHWSRSEIEELRVAYAVDDGFGDRFVEVPQTESREAYGDMEDFVGLVGSERLGDRLGRAIEGRGAFRRFKDVLDDHPDVRERWFRLRDERDRERALA